MKKNCLVLLALLSVVIGVALAWADPVEMQFLYTKKTTLSYPHTYTLRFSLWDADVGGVEVWSEEKAVKLNSSTIKTYLGDSSPIDPSDFTQQLWVQVERWKRSTSTWAPVGTTRDKLKAVAYSVGAPVIPTVLMSEQARGSLTVPMSWEDATPICQVGPFTAESDKTALIDSMIQYQDDAANMIRLLAGYSTNGGTSWSLANDWVVFASNAAGAWSSSAHLVDSLNLTADVTYLFAVMYDIGLGGTAFTSTDSLCRMRVMIVDR
jgi:hypothetical protein